MDESEQRHDTVDEDEHKTDEDEQMDGSEQHHDTVDEDEHTADEDEQTTDEDEETTDEDDGHEDGEEEGEEEEREGDYIEREYNEGEVAMHTSEYRFGAPMALVRHQLQKPGLAVAEWSAKSGERVGVARARVQEKLSRASADFDYAAYTFTHPAHPIRRKAAKDVKKQRKLLAADRRKQQELAVKSRAAAKVARVRAGEIATLNEAVK